MNIKRFCEFKNFIKENQNVKRCIIRCDLNLPSDVEDLSRVYAVKDTIHQVAKLGLDIMIISHYKRPKIDDIINPKFSLKNIIESVSNVLEMDVYFEKRSLFDIEPKDINHRITLMENLRFYEGETTDDEELAKRLAMFGDVYINDAFSVSHRKHTSVHAITKHLPSFAGISLEREIDGISNVTNDIKRPFTAIIGGSKVSSKIDVLKQISQTSDNLIIAGAMANTFLASKGYDLKESMVEAEYIETAKEIMANSKAKIILPIDFLSSISIEKDGTQCDLDSIPDGQACFDIGSKSIDKIIEILSHSNSLLWIGALGAFEFSNFNTSSNIITKHIAELTDSGELISVIGGGETIASIGNYKKNMTFVSTAGGAFLEFVAGYKLPGIDALKVKTFKN